ncbi:MAG: acyl-CoA dehydrogenase, partial [Actinobacteria bacterium]|nr:acyl-CoA dehydrogenase [Actinomycetota bacterium]
MSVDLGLTPDQESIAELFNGFFSNEAPPAVARAAEPLGFDRELWNKVIELGAPGMGCAAEIGGGGASLGDLVVVAETVGRSIAPIPLIDHLAALSVLSDADLVAGEVIAAVAV